MKVYELMSALADLPSGADVILNVVFSVDELKKDDVIDTDDKGNPKSYSFLKTLDSVEHLADKEVLLTL